MPTFFLRIQINPESEPELKEACAPDFLAAVQTLAGWCPGVHIIKREGVCTRPAGYA